MQQTTYARQLLNQIAINQNRPLAQVEPYILALEENWLDTREALSAMSDKDFDDLKIPKRIASLIKESVSKPLSEQTNYSVLIKQISTQISDQNQKNRTLGVLVKILQNVVENPLSPQFQSISISSKTLQNNVLQYPQAIGLMESLGWKIEGECLKVNYVVDQSWNQVIGELKNHISVEQQQEQKFNPYQASFSSRIGITNSDVARQEGYDVYSFSNQLERLQKKRFEIMSKKIEDREIKIFIGQKNQSVFEMQQKLQEMGEQDEQEHNQDSEFTDYLKQIAQSMEEQAFASKRKKEYETLFKKPVYSFTTIRVKMPADIVIELKYSPLERLQLLQDQIKSMLTNQDLPFYLYTTPPVIKMTQKYLIQTFDELDSVPNGLFYFSSDVQTQVLSNQWIQKAVDLKLQ